MFPNLKLRVDAVLADDGANAFMIRKGSPQLKAALDDFAKRQGDGTTFGNSIVNRYVKDPKFVKNALDPDELAKYERTVTLFRKYGDRYDFDALMLTAQGYQESQLDNQRRSRAGAVGVMQVLPKTGQDMQVGDVHKLDPNIHAGVKFLKAMMNEH